MNRKERRAAQTAGQEQHNTRGAVADLFNVAQGHLKEGRPGKATLCFRKAVKIAPQFGLAHYNLGFALSEIGQFSEAAKCFRTVIRLSPDFGPAYLNLGTSLKHLDQFEEAEDAFRKALLFSPKLAVAHYNLGAVLQHQMRLREAVDCYESAIGLAPDFTLAHNNLAMTQLALGDLHAGWQGFEWRWKGPIMAGELRNFSQPQWRGEEAVGKTLLIHAEQGFGDTLQFCRFAPIAAKRGLRVIMQVPKSTVRLIGGLEGVEQVITHEEAVPAFDFHCPMMSLPLALNTTLETIPSVTPYLAPDAAAVGHWKKRIDALSGTGIRVGLVWAGNSRKDLPGFAEIDARRSLPFERFRSLLTIKEVQFFSLQKDDRQALSAPQVHDLMDEVEDFADTAALIENLDLVVSVDTAVAHLAAALGKPVWLLNRFDSCWRWLAGRQDSPWYPTLRIYQQPRHHDWGTPIAEVARDLKNMAISFSH